MTNMNKNMTSLYNPNTAIINKTANINKYIISLKGEAEEHRRDYIMKLMLKLEEVREFDNERNSVFDEVPIEMFKFTHPAQRKLNERRVDDIAAHYDTNLQGSKKVVVTSDWYLEPIDGQHSILAAIKKGKKRVPCEIFFEIDLPTQAYIFAHQDDRHSRVSGSAKHHASTFYDDDAKRQEEIIYDEYHLTMIPRLDGGSDYHNITSVSEIKRIWKEGVRLEGDGEKALRFVLDLIAKAGWEHYSGAYKQHWMILGKLVYRYAYNNQTIIDEFIHIMQNTVPSKFEGDAKKWCEDAINKTYDKHGECAVRDYVTFMLTGHV